MSFAEKAEKLGGGLKSIGIGVAVLAGTALVVYTAYKIKQGAEVAGDAIKKVVTQDLNPASDKNIVYRQFDGDDGSSLGTRIYDWFH